MKKNKVNASSSEPTPHKCDWEGCKGNPHQTKVVYENKKVGCTDRDKYVGCWPMPFHIGTRSYAQYGVKRGELRRLKSSKFSITRSTRNNYQIVLHHVIPVDIMKGKSALKKNLKLIGWNINDGISNGICLPYFKEDQIWHDLQPHRGSHPQSYITAVNEMIAPLETVCKKYCLESENKKSKNNQETLKYDILNSVEKLRRRILNWTLKIHLSSTLTKWTNKIANKSNYYKSDTAKPSTPPMAYLSKRKGNRQYIKI